MLVAVYPNSEICVETTVRSSFPKKDTGRPKRTLTLSSQMKQSSPSGFERSERPGWGGLPFGVGSPRKGTRRRVLRLGGECDRLAKERGHDRLFITLTCPGSSGESVSAFCSWTSYLLHSLHNWIGIKVRRSGWDKGVPRLHSWELQKRGAEHLHIVYVLPMSVSASIQEGLREWYYNKLLKISELSGVDVFQRGGVEGTWRERPDILQIRAESVHSSVSAYLSKYLSKEMRGRGGSKSVRVMPRPFRLWGCSRVLSASLSQNVKSDYYDLLRPVELSLVPEVVELARSLGSSCSVSSWGEGVSNRVRVFFSGNSSAQAEFSRELDSLISRHLVPIPVTKGRVIAMGRLKEKAARINKANSTRKPFCDVYGDFLALTMTRWIEGGRVEKRDLWVLIWCLQDWDEVNRVSLRIPPITKIPKKNNFEQLQIILFPRPQQD